jgi:hypothetical protein
VSHQKTSSNREGLLTNLSRERAFQKYVRDWEQVESSGASSSNFCGEVDTHGSQGARRSVIGKYQPGKILSRNKPNAISNLDHEASISAYPSTNSRVSPAFTSPSIQQVHGSTQPIMQDTGWHFQNSGRSSTYSTAGDAVLYSSTTYQLGSPNCSSQKFTSQPSNTSVSTSASVPPNSVGGYQTSLERSPAPTAGATHLAAMNTTSWPEVIYSADSTEENDIAAQLDWEAANGDAP